MYVPSYEYERQNVQDMDKMISGWWEKECEPENENKGQGYATYMVGD